MPEEETPTTQVEPPPSEPPAGPQVGDKVPGSVPPHGGSWKYDPQKNEMELLEVPTKTE